MDSSKNSFISLIIRVFLATSFLGSDATDFKQNILKVCRSSGRALAEQDLRPLVKLAKDREKADDCDHSVGFHLTKELCESLGHSYVSRPALTAYSFGELTVVYLTVQAAELTPGSTNKTFQLKSFPEFNSKFFFVLWIKESWMEVPHHYKINYDGKNIKTEEHDMKTSGRFDEQKLLKDYPNRDLIITISMDKGRSGQIGIGIDQSYAITCLKPKDLKTNCEPILDEETERVYCECTPKDKLFTLIFFMVFWFVTILLITKPMVSLLLDTQKKEKTDIALNVNCNPKNARYIYVIFLRLAKASPDFDLRDVFIDIQFFAQNNEPIGSVVRFSASPLENDYIGQVRVFVFRLTKMPDLDKVRCQHNGHNDGRIILFGAFVFGNKGHEDYHKVYRINRDIARENREMRAIPVEDSQKLEDPTNLKSLDSFPIHLSFLEVVWIIFVNISVISLIAHLLAISVLKKGTFLHMSLIVLITSVIASLFNLLLIKFYKWLVRGELKQKTLMDSRSENTYFLIIKGLIIFLVICSVIIGIILSYQRTTIKDIETYRLICIIFCATSIVLLLWNIGSHLHFATNSQATEPLSVDDSSSLMSVNSDKQSSD